ncbi:MAG: BatA domain-containing protein [Planctomycetota bacterium]|nr:BatA domain-containing protein [Planctomycetota bacterium]
MGFLQPWLLIALPLALIPIVIHLVNQWRYQTKPWAAMMFLLRAKTLDRGFDRLRSWLILAMRVAAVLGLILAASRPISSGLMAWISGGDIDTVIVLVDCSPSMLATGAQNDLTKHKTALSQLAKSLAVFNASKWVLVDSNSLKASNFSSSSSLLQSPNLRVSDAACDWPAMIESAIAYLDREKPGQAQLWMVSDLQATNFKVDSPRWSDIRKRLRDAKTTTRWTSIEYPEQPASNYAIRVTDARWVPTATDANSSKQVSLDLLLSMLVLDTSTDNDTASAASVLPASSLTTVPVTIAWQGNETQVSVDILAGRGELKDFRVGSVSNLARNGTDTTNAGNRNSSSQSWGRVQLALDGNLADNEDFFAVDVSPIAKTLIVSERVANVLPVMIAAQSPSEANVQSEVSTVTPNLFDQLQLDGVAFLVWQADLPNEKSLDAIESFIKRGGTVWFFPPELIAEQIAAPKPNANSDRLVISQIAASQTSLRQFRWEEWLTLADPISPTSWISDTGLLRSTQSGASLEMGELKVRRLATMSVRENVDINSANKLKPIASFADGKILIGSLAVLHSDSGLIKPEPMAIATGVDVITTHQMPPEASAYGSGSGFPSSQGEAVMWGTFPSEDFSNLGYTSGVVLYVAVQRALESGLRSLKSIVQDIAQSRSSSGDDFKTTNNGSRLPSRDQWEPLLTTDRFLSNQIESHAGVFRASAKLVSVHRPLLEDEAKTLETADWNRLFEGVPIKRLSEQTGSRDDLQSESWRTFVMILIIALLVEAVMSLPKSQN